MTFLLAALLAFATLPEPSPMPTCAGRPMDPATWVDLAELEAAYDVPGHRRGILAAVWCVESRWAPPEPVQVGDGGLAVGPMQIHPPHVARCSPGHHDADPRTDLLWSARCWLTRVEQIMAKARYRCPGRQAWDVAEAMLSNPQLYAWKCDARSAHVRLLDQWRLSFDGRRKVAVDDLHLDAKEAPYRLQVHLD